MRIRSNLTDGTIYEAVRAGRGASREHGAHHSGVKGPGNRSSRSPSRRLMRLVILLALVLILMREAANPNVYRNFFGALGAPLVAEPLPEEISQTQMREILATQAETVRGHSTQVTESSAPDAVPQWPEMDGIIADLGKDGRRELTAWLAQVRRYERDGNQLEADLSRSESPVGPESTSSQLVPASSLRNMLASAAAGSGQLDPQKFVLEFESSERILSRTGSNLRNHLQTALDRDYLTRVSDATIWTKQDGDAFYRWLEIGSSGELVRSNSPVFVGFVSLLDQPAVYRGVRVAMRGAAVRVQHLKAAQNPFGIEKYWLIWLRPEDGSDRPVMGYAEQIPDGLKKLTSTDIDEQGPTVLLDGVFLRRHLYQSEKGSELAPVIVGRVQLLETQRDTMAAAGQAGGGPSRDRAGLFSTFGLMIFAAALVGIGFTLIVARYTDRTGRWRRQVRQRGLASPVEFLQAANPVSVSNLGPVTSLGPTEPNSEEPTHG